MVIAWLATRTRNKLMGLSGSCARAIGGLLDDDQGAEITPDQWIEAPESWDDEGSDGSVRRYESVVTLMRKELP